MNSSEYLYGIEPDAFFRISTGSYQWTFSRHIFLARYPESMIGLALQDRSAEVIEITEKCVTPTVMSILYCMVNSITSESHKIGPLLQDKHVCSQIAEASRYLLIPELGLWSHPYVIDTTRRYGLITSDMSQHNYFEYMKCAIDNDYYPFIDYAMNNIKVDSTYDKQLFFYCVIQNKFTSWVKFIEKERVDVKSCKLMYRDVKYLHTEIYSVLCDVTGQNVFETAQRYERKNMIQYLLDHT